MAMAVATRVTSPMARVASADGGPPSPGSVQMPLKASRLAARLSWQSKAIWHSSSSGSCQAAACHPVISVATVLKASASWWFIRGSPRLLAGGRVGRCAGVGLDGDVAVAELGPVPGHLLVPVIGDADQD